MNSTYVAITDVASSQLGGGTGLVGRPRVFVSSTIYDFRDPRSALKWWLEQMGCEVRMSEFTDFNRPPEQGALKSCFAAIQDCHFYLLLTTIAQWNGSTHEHGLARIKSDAIATARAAILTEYPLVSRSPLPGTCPRSVTALTASLHDPRSEHLIAPRCNFGSWRVRAPSRWWARG